MPTAAKVLMSTFGLLCSLLAPAAAGAAERAASGAVVILADNGAVHGIGAGTIVGIDGSQLRILTAKHVATFGTLRVRLDDGTQLPAHVLTLSAERDLAVVETDAGAASERLHAAPVADPRSNEPIYVWGSGNDGPAYEPGAVQRVGASLPDGAPQGRYALACGLCHQGDSGAGIFNERGALVGVYIGYFEQSGGRLSVAERPLDPLALAMLGNAAKIARSNMSVTPAIVASSGAVPLTTAPRTVASTSVSSAVASPSGSANTAVPADARALK